MHASYKWFRLSRTLPFVDQSDGDVEREPAKKKRKKEVAIDTPSISRELPSWSVPLHTSLVDAPTYTNLSRRFRELLFSARRHNIECISVHGRAVSRSLLYAGLFHARFSRSTLLPSSPHPSLFPAFIHAGNVLLGGWRISRMHSRMQIAREARRRAAANCIDEKLRLPT